ncbi:Neurotransmitter-gated ion-channel transmembrane region, partial [Ancylostoma caninum]
LFIPRHIYGILDSLFATFQNTDGKRKNLYRSRTDFANRCLLFCSAMCVPGTAHQLQIQDDGYGIKLYTSLLACFDVFVHYFASGAYSCLRTIIELKREFSYYLLQLYIPSFMLVAVSWVSFWLDKDSVPARVTLGVTTLLTMTTQASGVNANLPPVSYTKAIDIWIGVCLAFIFGALLEFALVNWAARQDIAVQTSRARQQNLHMLFRVSYLFQENSRRIDLISRVMFPSFFMVFNVTYWWRYLTPYLAVQAQLE